MLFDEFHEGTDSDPIFDAGTRSEVYISGMEGSRYLESSSANHATILGAKQKTLTISELLMASEDVAFTSFCSRISQAVQALSFTPADTIAVHPSHQVPCFISLMLCFTDRL